MLHSRYIRGNLAFWDMHRMRIVDAMGPGVFKWEIDPSHFQQTGGNGSDPVGYVTTVVEVGAGTSEAEASDEDSIAIELVTAANDNDGISLQLLGQRWLPSNKDMYFGIKLEASDATDSDFFVGLGVVNTNPLGGLTDGIYFECLDGGTGISGVTEKDSGETQTDSLGTFADDTAVTLEWYLDGTSVYFFVDGAQAAIHTLTIPTDQTLTPTIQFLNGAAGAERMKVHWARAIALG